MSTFTIELPTGQQQDTASRAAVAFIASYSSEATRRTYTTQLRLWMAWCTDHHLDPLVDIRRPPVGALTGGVAVNDLSRVIDELIVLVGERTNIHAWPPARE